MKYQSEFDNNEMNRIQDEFKRLKGIIDTGLKPYCFSECRI